MRLVLPVPVGRSRRFVARTRRAINGQRAMGNWEWEWVLSSAVCSKTSKYVVMVFMENGMVTDVCLYFSMISIPAFSSETKRTKCKWNNELCYFQ